jgi:hypothetical protein
MANTDYLMSLAQQLAAGKASQGVGATGGGNSTGNLQNVLDILGSKGGQTAVSMAGAGLSAYGAAQDRNAAREDNLANRQMNAQQFAAQMAQRQSEQDESNQMGRAQAAVSASPMGAEQEFAQRNALFHQLLGSARNFSVTPGDPAVAGAMGKMSGGMRLPEGGLDPAMLDRLYGDKATLASIQGRQNAIGQLNPMGQQTQLGAMFGAAGNDASAAVSAGQQGLANTMQTNQDAQRQIIMRALDNDITGEKQPQEKKKGNIFGKILKGVGVGASFIPGVGQIVAPIATFAGGMVDGDGFKKSLVNGGLAAIPAGLGKVAKGVGTAATIAKAAQKLPVQQIAGSLIKR